MTQAILLTKELNFKKFIKVEPALSAQVKVVRILKFIRVCEFFYILQGLLSEMLLEKVY